MTLAGDAARGFATVCLAYVLLWLLLQRLGFRRSQSLSVGIIALCIYASFPYTHGVLMCFLGYEPCGPFVGGLTADEMQTLLAFRATAGLAGLVFGESIRTLLGQAGE